MSDELNMEGGSLSLQTREEIDKVCDQFEMVCQSGEPGKIEPWLAGWNEPSRRNLFRELLLVELTYRKRKGAEPAVADYVNRFQDYRDIVQEVFAELRAGPHSEPKSDLPG